MASDSTHFTMFNFRPLFNDITGKVWDAVEVSGKNVMQTSSVVTTSVVTHR